MSPETPTNTPARGVPTISGSARVGETLTVDTSGISDAEGMDNAVFTYRWPVGGTDILGATGSNYTLTEADEGLTIDGAASSTYTLQSSDNGKAIKVQIVFTDDVGGEDSLTGAGTAAVLMGGL